MANEVPVSRSHLHYLAEQVEVALKQIHNVIRREQRPAGRLGEVEEILNFVRDRLEHAARSDSSNPPAHPPAKVIKLRHR